MEPKYETEVETEAETALIVKYKKAAKEVSGRLLSSELGHRFWSL